MMRWPFFHSHAEKEVIEARDKQLLNAIDFCVIDCEMTGLDAHKDEILSIGAVRIREGRVDLADSFYRQLRTDTQALATDNVLIHRMGHEEIEQAEEPQVVLKDFREFVGSSIPLGHCFDFDQSFLKPAFKAYGIEPLPTAIDSAYFYRWHVLRNNRYLQSRDIDVRLETLMELYELPEFYSHQAFNDALVTACLFLKLQDHFHAAGLHTFGDLRRIACR